MRVWVRLLVRLVLPVMVGAAALAPAAAAAPPPPDPGDLTDTVQPGGTHEAEPRIVGGRATSTSEHPWMVALVTDAGAPYCGGALVAPDRVLTAAHCVAAAEPASLRVVSGRTDMRTDDGVVSRVREVWVHPGYRSAPEGDDVAVLTLDRAPGYATIPVERDPRSYPAGRIATVYGWGYTAEGGPSSPVLRRADVPLRSDADCSRSYREFDPASMVCAGAPEGGADACNGDSGGPLVAAGRLIGITSFGSGCARAGLPGVYTRITSYSDAVGEQLR